MSVVTGIISKSDDDGYIRFGLNDFSSIDSISIDSERYPFFLFSNLTIPHGSKINSARIDFTFVGTGIFNNHVNTIRVFGQSLDHIENIPIGEEYDFLEFETDSEVFFNTETGVSTMQTPNLGNIIQEIVDRPGWSTGNKMMILFESISGDTNFIEGYGSTLDTTPAYMVVDFDYPITTKARSDKNIKQGTSIGFTNKFGDIQTNESSQSGHDFRYLRGRFDDIDYYHKLNEED